MSGAHDWVVHKFGGTSVANAARYREAAALLEREDAPRTAVVVSAMAKVTDALHALADLACRQDDGYAAQLDALVGRHADTARELLGPEAAAPVVAALAADARDIADVLRTVRLGRAAPEALVELVAGYGEVWSARTLAGYLAARGRRVRCLDARDVLVVHPAELGPAVDWGVSRTKLRAWLAADEAPWLVVTGYVASTAEGAPTTLKRNGSDFSAAIFGALLDARAVTIWTDVDGVLSADPRRVPEAVVLDELSYDEAAELAYFGAKVLHPRTMAPAVAQDIPLWIRNTFNPSHPGTRIWRASERGRSGGGDGGGPAAAVRGFSAVDNVALINVEGTGLVGVPGVAQRIFGALREVGISVVMISQASSEHSVCFAVPAAQGAGAQAAVERAFAPEVAGGQVRRVERVDGCSVIAAVGAGMAHTPGVAARLFAALGRAGVNVRAIAQGSSERNLSVVVDGRDATRALRAAHAGFYLSEQVLSVGIIGPGLVGSALLAQLAAQAPVLRAARHVDLRVRAVMNRSRMHLAEASLDPGAWRESLAQAGTPADLAAFVDHVAAPHLPHAVLVDCTANDAVADLYPAWLARGIHVVTPNKRAGAGPLARYRAIRRLGYGGARARFLDEATVGAGLPVVNTLRDLVASGDRVERIEGVLSGTLAYVFNAFTGETPFSSVVREARRLGYTEPDPRDDLEGTDVARKLVILGREIGLDLELADVDVQSLVPAALRQGVDAAGFLAGLPADDARMAGELAAARDEGCVLRYVGVIEASGRASAALRRYATRHPFARITGSDNILAFTTTRYHTQPLIVQGPGAGPDVTAGGIFADLLRLAAAVGGPA